MKSLNILISALLLQSLTVISQNPCLPEGIEFTTQAQIDNFQVNYPGCMEIVGDVEISGEDITNLEGLNVLTAIGGNLLIISTENLSDLSGLNNLTQISGSLGIGDAIWYTGNTSLSSLTGLENLSTIGGLLGILHNDSLTDLMGLNNLDLVGDWIIIGFNPLLQNVHGLEGLTTIPAITIGNCPSLTGLAGIDNVSSIEEHMIVGENELMAHLELSGNLTAIGTRLVIFDNSILTDLSGLENVTYIGGDIEIHDNPELLNLFGLNNVDPGSIMDLSVYENNNLSSCHATSICEYLLNPAGTVEIHDNAPGCDSQQEVEEACWSGISETISEQGFIITPNPCFGSITIGLVISDHGIAKCDLFNISGVKVKTLLNKPITAGANEINFDLSELNPGIYFCTLKTNNGIYTRKMIKL